MIVQMKFAAIKGIKPHEWAVRFVFGGAVCVIAGLIAKKFGPGLGGLFLAFPAIFPAGASLVETHEKEHKNRAGLDGTQRGRTVAGLDAVGASLGSIGLAGFGLVCWLGLPHWNAVVVLGLATIVWLLVSAVLWWLRKSRTFRTGRSRRRTQPLIRAS
jgi:hypothetical protein